MRCLRPQSAIRRRDAYPIGNLLGRCVAHAGERGDTRDPTASPFQLNHRLRHKISFNFRPPEMVNPFRS